MRESNGGNDSLPLYESQPADWLSKVHTAADLGYHGFHPPRPGQDEDDLSKDHMKNGFILGHPIHAETFSAQDTINSRFSNENALTELEELMNQVFTRKADHIPPIPASSFRMPSRVTLNDAKRQAWFADLANPEVPLHKLGKSVPHGAKGHDLLDLLQKNDVAIPRAVWLLRVFGANETAGLRNKPSYNPTQYSIDWANVVIGYMKKQLADIGLPSAPRPGLNIKTTFKGVLSDADTRGRWISRFTYCLKLLRNFYSEGLVDNHTFLTWLVQQMSTCNLAQACFVGGLADEYLDGMLTSRALTRPFVDACLVKLTEIRTTSAQEYLGNLAALLCSLLQRVCLALPDAYISPRTWTTHEALLNEVLTSKIVAPREGQVEQGLSYDIEQTLSENFSDIKRRNEAMLFSNLPPRPISQLRSAATDIQLLNSISSTTDLHAFSYFRPASGVEETELFASKLDTLLSWSVTPLQYGDHRPFAAVSLLRIWRDKTEACTTPRDITTPDKFVQDQLFDWLDRSDVAAYEENKRTVALLFGQLVECGLFSFGDYIQRLIARGEPGLSLTEENGSRHRDFLRCIPLHKPTSSLISQRKVTLHGARAREAPEDSNEREIRREIRVVLPEVFGGEQQPTYLTTEALLVNCTTLLLASRFEQVRVLRQWLLPILRKHIASQAADAAKHSTILKLYGVSVELMAHTRCYSVMLDLSLCLLEHSTTIAMLTAVIETIHRYVDVWACMQSTASIAVALYSSHQLWRAQGVQSRTLLALLVEIDNGRHLDLASREHVVADMSSFKDALQPVADHPDPVPPVLPEILLLAEDPSPEAPSLLANGLWYKYRTAFDWAWKVWDNTVASLRQVPVMTTDIADRRACALRYGRFLLHVDQHLPSGLDDHVLRWFLETGKSEVAALSVEAWDVLTVVLLYLSVHGALTTTTILRGLVYPAWQLVANPSSGQHTNALETFVEAVNNLVDQLLFRDLGGTEGIPPVDLLDIQRIRTRRLGVYQEPHFSLLVASIPTLVSIEMNERVSEEFRQAALTLRNKLCKASEFRQGANRHLETVHNVFELALQSGSVEDNLGDAIIGALGLIWCDDQHGGSNVDLNNLQNISSLLRPCKLAAASLQLRLILSQIGRYLTQESTCHTANGKIDKLTFTIFHQPMSSEEAGFVAELTKDVDSQVAGKFIKNGLQCISELLQDATITSEQDMSVGWVEHSGQILRVLAHVAEPLWRDPSLLPRLELDVQDKLISTLCAKFKSLESVLDEDPSARVVNLNIFLARLLQFVLGFIKSWTAKTIETGISLSSTLLQLALRHGAGDHLDLVAYPLMIDTLYYLLDEMSADSKHVILDPFHLYPEIPLSDLPKDMPPQYLAQLTSILPHVTPNAAVANLVNAHRDSAGTLVYGAPVLNRPWEWIENLGDQPVLDPKEEEREREEKERLKVKYLVKNSASLTLEAFGARMTGDGVVANLSLHDAGIESNVRTFEDGLSAESVFKRDWRETRRELADEVLLSIGRPRGEDEDDVGPIPLLSTQTQTTQRSTPRKSSPTSSARSRGSVASVRQSPGLSSMSRASESTTGEVVEIQSTATSISTSKKASKRKASHASDEDIEIVEGPVAATSRVLKKVKTKAMNRPRAKKR